MLYEVPSLVRAFFEPHKDTNGSANDKQIQQLTSAKRTSVSAKSRIEIHEKVEKYPLNKPQRKAVEHLFGPMLVLAGAGTGKTRVIIMRFAELIGHGVPPRRILGVTFTNKAVKEMRTRSKELLGPYSHAMPTLKTLHGLCAGIMRIHYKTLGYERPTEVVEDTKKFLERSIRALSFETISTIKGEGTKAIASQISDWKNNLISPDEAMKRYNDIEHMVGLMAARGSTACPPENPYKLAPAYKAYQEILDRACLIDCDDLIRLAVKLFQENPLVLQAWQNRYDHIMVDEFQDTNLAQLELVKQLAASHGNLTVVGDDDQSIYGWRSANVEIIRDFAKNFNGCEIVKLVQNYRCTQRILDLGNKLMESEFGRFAKKLVAFKKGGAKPRVALHENEHDEADWITEIIQDAHDSKGEAYSSNVILLRDQYKMDPIIESLQNKNIPYEIWASEDIQMGEVKQNVYSLLAVIHNPVEKDYAFMQLIDSSPLGLKDHDLMIFNSKLDSKKYLSYWDAINSQELRDSLSEDGARNMRRLANMVRRLHQKTKILSGKFPLTQIAEEAIHTLYRETTKDRNWRNAKKPLYKLRTLQDIANYIESWEKSASNMTLNAFLGWAKRVRIMAKEPKREANSAVVISTIHAVKGLEFDNVYIAALCEGILPSKHAIEKEDDDKMQGINEERRLMYVAITRAKNCLYLSWSNYRKEGRRERVDQVPSRFLGECGAIEIKEVKFDKVKIKSPPKDLFGDEISKGKRRRRKR